MVESVSSPASESPTRGSCLGHQHHCPGPETDRGSETVYQADPDPMTTELKTTMPVLPGPGCPPFPQLRPLGAMGPLVHNSFLQPHLVLVAVSAVTGGAPLAGARLCVVLTGAACPVLLVTRICMAITLASVGGRETGVIVLSCPTGALAGCCICELQSRPEETTGSQRSSPSPKWQSQDQSLAWTDHSEGRRRTGRVS